MNHPTPPTPETSSNWKTQTYLIGVIGGTAFGLVCAYFYTRSAEDDVTKRGFARPNRVQSGDVIGLGLAGLAIMRQVAELGRTPEKPPRRR